MDLGTLLGLDVEALDEGGAEVRLTADERHLNPGGTVHGGAIATLVDTAMGAAVSAGADGERPVTVEMKVSYLEPAGPGLLTATAKVRRRGSRLTIMEAEVEQDGDVVAFATATFTTV
jgi:uncharacterized protein (TIGR00369 family)